jgi:uncharacterized Tic20 family protein
MNQEIPSQDRRIMAALAHAGALILGTGIIAAVVVWITQKDRSRYVAFQALQALVYQTAGVVVQIIGWGCWTALYTLSLIPLLASADSASEPPLFFLLSTALMVVPLVLMGLWALGGLWGAVRALQGREFRYLGIGALLERWQSDERD